jgi:hypothetical protein
MTGIGGLDDIGGPKRPARSAGPEGRVAFDDCEPSSKSIRDRSFIPDEDALVASSAGMGFDDVT